MRPFTQIFPYVFRTFVLSPRDLLDSFISERKRCHHLQPPTKFIRSGRSIFQWKLNTSILLLGFQKAPIRSADVTETQVC